MENKYSQLIDLISDIKKDLIYKENNYELAIEESQLLNKLNEIEKLKIFTGENL